MLDSVTKKRIDDLRNILVGKIPSPQSQVEQITTGLIYKFMYDMDAEAVEMGGVPSFFVGEFEKYSWKHLFDPKLGGADKVQLYSDAIENMYTNPTAPALFREIFKNSSSVYPKESWPSNWDTRPRRCSRERYPIWYWRNHLPKARSMAAEGLEVV